MNKFPGGKDAGTIGAGFKLMVGVILAVAVVGGIIYAVNQARPGTIAIPTTGAAGAVISGVPSTTTVVTTGGSSAGKPANYNALIVNKYSGGYQTGADDIAYFAPAVDPGIPTTTSIDTGTPGTQDTTQAIVCGNSYKFVYRDGVTTYAISRFGTDGSVNERATAGVLECPDTTAAAASVVDTWPTKAVTVATIGDPLEENSPTNGTSQSINGIDPPAASAQYLGSDASCGVVGSTATDGTDGDNEVIFYNETSCGGTFYITFVMDSGTTANTGWREPVLCFRDPNFNRSGAEITSATLSTETGFGFTITEPTVTSHMNNNQCVKMWPAGGERDIPSNTRHTVRLDMTLAEGETANGEQWDIFLDDLGDVSAWKTVTANTGFAQTASTSINFQVYGQ